MMIRRAERLGIPWSERVAALGQVEWQPHWQAVTDPSLAYPGNYRASFHGYDAGHLCWEAAFEFEVASNAVHSSLYPGAGAHSDGALRRGYHEVLLHDVAPAAMEEAVAFIGKQMDRGVKKEKWTGADAEAALKAKSCPGGMKRMMLKSGPAVRMNIPCSSALARTKSSPVGFGSPSSSTNSTPIISPPCVCIVAAGKSRHEVVPVLGGMEVHRIMPLSLTFDHRACTGGEAARFLKAMLEDPWMEVPSQLPPACHSRTLCDNTLSSLQGACNDRERRASQTG